MDILNRTEYNSDIRMKCGSAHRYGGAPHGGSAHRYGGAPHGGSAHRYGRAPTGRRSPHRGTPSRSDSIRQKPDKPKANIMKRVGEQK